MSRKYVTILKEYNREGKTSVLVVRCESVEESRIVRKNAEDREGYDLFMVTPMPPIFSARAYTVAMVDEESAPEWFRPGAFQKRKEGGKA